MDEITRNYPAIQEFNTSSRGDREKAIAWRDVEKDKVFQVVNFREVKVGGSLTFILTLTDEASNSQDVWATGLIKRKLDCDKDLYAGKEIYIISKGEKESRNKRMYYDFRILYR